MTSVHETKLSYVCKRWLTVVVLVLLALEGRGDELFSSTSAEPREGAVESPIALTLPEALSLALRQSPALAAFSWDIRAADAMIEQAGLRPNPQLSVELEEVRWSPGPSGRKRSSALSGPPVGMPAVSWERERIQGARSGFRESELTISIAQPIQLGKKRAKRIAAAERKKELILWDYQAARADVLAQTAADFAHTV